MRAELQHARARHRANWCPATVVDQRSTAPSARCRHPKCDLVCWLRRDDLGRCRAKNSSILRFVRISRGSIRTSAVLLSNPITFQFRHPITLCLPSDVEPGLVGGKRRFGYTDHRGSTVIIEEKCLPMPSDRSWRAATSRR